MIVRFSKEFSKSAEKLSGKLKESVRKVINEVIDVNCIEEISNCKKIETFNNVYRIRIGSQRAFFVLHIEIEGNVVKFEYLISRGEAYNKKNMERLRRKDT